MRSNSWQFSFNLWYLYELKHKVCLSKSMSGIFHFWFHFVFIKIYVFVQQKGWTLLVQNVIILFKTGILEKPHMLLVPYPCFFFKLQKEVKIQWCLMSSWVGAPQKLTCSQIFWTYKMEVWRMSVFLISTF